MRPRFEFLLTTGLVILSRIGDGLSTHLVTPDLSREMNPLAAGGWPALIAAAAVVLALSTALNYCHLFRPVDNFPQALGLNLAAFKRHYFDPHANTILAARTGSVLAYVFGYIVPRTIIVWSLLLIVNNLLTAFEFEPYVSFKKAYPLWIAFYLMLPVLALLFLERLQRLDFARYQAASSPSTSANGMTHRQPHDNTPSNPEVDRSISAERALLLLFLLAGPIVLVEWAVFSMVWGRAALWNGLDVVLTLQTGVFLFIAGLLTHEFVHGLTWKLLGRVPWRQIRFGFQLKTFTPYAHVTTALPARAYRWGTVMPLLAVGLLPFLIGLAFNQPVWAAFGMVFTFVAGGDLAVLWTLRGVSGSAMVRDHPERVGCYIAA